MLQKIDKFVNESESFKENKGLDEIFNEQENLKIIKHKSVEWNERIKALADNILLLSEAIDDNSIPTTCINEIYNEDGIFRDDSELNNLIKNIECSVDIALAKIGLKIDEDKHNYCTNRWNCNLFLDEVQNTVLDYILKKIESVNRVPLQINEDTFEEGFNNLFEESDYDSIDENYDKSADNNKEWIMNNLLGDVIDFAKDFDKEWKILFTKDSGGMTSVGERIIKILSRHQPIFVSNVYIEFINNNEIVNTYAYDISEAGDKDINILYNIDKLYDINKMIDGLLYSGNFNLKVRVIITEKYNTDSDIIETETEVKKFRVYIKK